MVYEKMYESNDEVEKQPSNLRPISQVIRNRLNRHIHVIGPVIILLIISIPVSMNN